MIRGYQLTGQRSFVLCEVPAPVCARCEYSAVNKQAQQYQVTCLNSGTEECGLRCVQVHAQHQRGQSGQRLTGLRDFGTL